MEINIARNIYDYRKQYHLTQRFLAKFTGVHRNTIAAIENGERYPSLELAVKLSMVFRCRLDKLVFSRVL